MDALTRTLAAARDDAAAAWSDAKGRAGLTPTQARVADGVATVVAATSAVALLAVVERARRNRAAARATNGIPGDQGFPLVGGTAEFAVRGPRVFFGDLIDKYGRVFRTDIMGTPTVVVAPALWGKDTEEINATLFSDGLRDAKVEFAVVPTFKRLLKDFLLTKSGRAHRVDKKMLVDALSPRLLKENLPVMGNIFQDGLAQLAAEGPKGVLAFNAYRALVWRFIQRLILAGIPEKESDVVLERIMDQAKGFLAAPIDLGKNSTFGQAIISHEANLAYVRQLCEDRRNGKLPPQKDLLQLLVDFRDEETGAPSDPSSVAGNFLVSVFGSLETTASILASITRLLADQAKYKPFLDKLTEESWRVMPTDKDYDVEKLGELVQANAFPYLDAFMLEVFRLYPPLTLTMRRAVVDIQLPGPEGFVIPKGWNMFTDVSSSIRRDAARFPNPTEFMPERFLAGGVSEKEASFTKTMLLFGRGTHRCPGEAFAVVETKVLMAILTRRAGKDGSKWPRLVCTRKEADYFEEIPGIVFSKLRVQFF